MSPSSWGTTGRDYDDDWPGWAEEERMEEDDPSEGDSGKKKLAQAQREVVVISDEHEGSDKTKSHRHLGVPCAFSELKGKTTSSTPRSRRTMRGTAIGRAT